MRTLQIVLLANGKYAVRVKRGWCGAWGFCESAWTNTPEYGRTWGSGGAFPEHVIKYCLIDTESEAEVVLEKTIEALSGKGLKVKKVIRTVKV